MFIFRVSSSRAPEPDDPCPAMSFVSSHFIPGDLRAASRVNLRNLEDATFGMSPSGLTVAIERRWAVKAPVDSWELIRDDESAPIAPDMCFVDRRARCEPALLARSALSMGETSTKLKERGRKVITSSGRRDRTVVVTVTVTENGQHVLQYFDLLSTRALSIVAENTIPVWVITQVPHVC